MIVRGESESGDTAVVFDTDPRPATPEQQTQLETAIREEAPPA